MNFPNKQTHSNGFSLVEVIVMITVVGILSAIAVSQVGKITDASKKTVAQNLVETLNNATKEFGHAQYKLVSNGENEDATDEMQILRTLQWKDPDIELGVAGPFMRGDWSPSTSSNTDDYRIVWAGSFWKLAVPGAAGSGIKVNFEAADLGQTYYTYPDDFTPAKFALDEPDESGDVEGLTGEDLIDAINDGLNLP
ncbi:MAG: type II secretion system protein [Verrucomicrobiales bacterium]|nr:type II secretion system protein [Verrucomicrobiales bacterium]